MRRNCPYIIFCILTFPLLTKAQFGNESPIPYFRYSVTAGLGATQLYGDLDNRQLGGGVYLRGNYFLTHGVSIGLELQEGLLRGEDNASVDGLRRRSTNLFHAAIIGVNFQPFKYLQDDHLRRIEYRQSYGKRVVNSVYAGAGVGAVYSLQWDNDRAGYTNSNGSSSVSPTHQGKDYGLSYIMSTNVGLELPLHSLKPNLLDSYIWNLIICGQLNFSLDDELDGYSGTYPGNDSKDVYSFLTIGVNLRF
ncbi:hypothetical protein [Parapedobacter tibetensis]|uniref:hypothetical protein n=1 Tax=Parapedobacter tibetensis TaxID=2972951 RepID=UPI00214D1A96|nr:hypothetical protein [Parapedobacter tibetensis]